MWKQFGTSFSYDGEHRWEFTIQQKQVAVLYPPSIRPDDERPYWLLMIDVGFLDQKIPLPQAQNRDDAQAISRVFIRKLFDETKFMCENILTQMLMEERHG